MPIQDFKCMCGKVRNEVLTAWKDGQQVDWVTKEPVKCECGHEMEMIHNLTSFPGMQVGKHHYGGGRTVMKRKSQGPRVKNRQQNE
jgi:hypothetical protein